MAFPIAGSASSTTASGNAAHESASPWSSTATENALEGCLLRVRRGTGRARARGGADQRDRPRSLERLADDRPRRRVVERSAGGAAEPERHDPSRTVHGDV